MGQHSLGACGRSFQVLSTVVDRAFFADRARKRPVSAFGQGASHKLAARVYTDGGGEIKALAGAGQRYRRLFAGYAQSSIKTQPLALARGFFLCG